MSGYTNPNTDSDSVQVPQTPTDMKNDSAEQRKATDFERQIDELDEEFDRINSGFRQNVDAGLSELESGLNELEPGVDNMDKELTTLEVSANNEADIEDEEGR